MNKNLKNFYLILVLIGIGFLAALAVKKLATRPTEKKDENPFEYNVDEFKNVPPELINYKELPEIKVPLKNLRGIAIDSNNRIYVTGDKNLLIFDKSGRQISNLKLSGQPGCLAVTGNGDIFINIDSHIEIYDKNGKQKAVWDAFASDVIITSIAVTKENVFVADAGNKVVLKLDLKGKILSKIDGKNKAEGLAGFIVPSPYFDLLIDANQHLWVVNPGEHKLEQFTENGSLISIWGKASMQIDGFCGCCNPTHIARLADDSIVTSEKGLPRVKIYDATGQFLSVVAGPQQFEEDTVGLDLAVDSKDRILVLDPKKGAVRIFIKK